MNITPISNFSLCPLLFLTSCISGFAFFLFDKCVWCRRHAVVLLQGSTCLFTIESRHLSRLTSCFRRCSGIMLASALAVTVCERVIDDGSDDG